MLRVGNFGGSAGSLWGCSMDDTDKPESAVEDRPVARARRPWHAPQFIVADAALTDHSSSGGSDGGLFPAPDSTSD
jgi:hypothetical protein